jgi:hypothetical protein
VEPGRLASLLTELDNDRRRGADVGALLCTASAEVLAVSGAGIMLMVEGKHGGSLGVSNETINVVEELQFTLGEGPCIDAVTSARPVLEPDLAAPAVIRWPAFAGPAIAAGVRAVFGFPLRSGTTSLGALDVYLDEPGDLRVEQLADASIMAEVISHTVLALQSDAPPGDLADQLGPFVEHRALVHQASGMVSAQLDISVEEALLRIRAYSYTEDRPIRDVAQDIVDRQLRFDPPI